MDIIKCIGPLVPEMKEWRRYLHAHPETAFQEINTSEFIAEKLKSFGLEAHKGMAKTGVIGILKRGSKDDAIGLRADIDALAIHEESYLEYKSQNPGKMHACGHDGHTTMLLGAAKYLAERGKFNGAIYFIFQPAEENEGGGRVMVEEGIFDKYPMRSIFALHNYPGLPVGYFAIRTGPFAAAYDVFDIIIKCKGGHAGTPHVAQDPVIVAAYLIAMLQTIVSRNIDPIDTAVVSVTTVHGGTEYNVLPDIVSLSGTTRHFTPHAQDLVEARIKSIAAGVASSFGMNIEVKYQRRYPPLVNSPQETEQAVETAAEMVGRENVLTNIPPGSSSEDFAFMLQKKPGAYMIIGAGTADAGHLLHQSKYDFNDEVLPIGVGYWVAMAESLLPP